METILLEGLEHGIGVKSKFVGCSFICWMVCGPYMFLLLECLGIARMK
jgi:hypothetical protein